MPVPVINPLAPFLARQGFLVLDGGLATELEARGFDLDDPLWSARLLVEAPDAVRTLHRDYLDAGADCIISASYQASLPGFQRRGLDSVRAVALLRLAVTLAREARDSFWAEYTAADGNVTDQPPPGESAPARRRLRPLVAASVGPYGAYLADGSEYSGRYGLGVADLADWHRPRWQILAGAGADLLACETIPSALEARALLELLRGSPAAVAWFSFSCQDAARLHDGTPLDDAVGPLLAEPRVIALGINCTAPRFIPDLLARLSSLTDKPLLVYPNSGEVYDQVRRQWQGLSDPEDWGHRSRDWLSAGARLIGGCCRTGPAHVRQIRAALHQRPAGRRSAA